MASVFPSLEGKYEILEKLHEGGMGPIYKVRHRLLDEVRVIKVMRPQHQSDDGLRARFLREAQVAVKLRHQHIAQMYDFAFDDAGHGFIVMEYVEGISLQELLARVGAPPLALSLELARQAPTALLPAARQAKQSRDTAATAAEKKRRPEKGLEALGQVTPDFHGNKTVELYVVADDFAGHTTRLGSPEPPLGLKKRGLF